MLKIEFGVQVDYSMQVTIDGLKAHFVQPEAASDLIANIRDPSRLTMSKRNRVGEE